MSDEITQLAQTVPRGSGEAAHGCDAMTPDQVCEGEKPPPHACEELAGMAGRFLEGRAVRTFLRRRWLNPVA